MSLSLPSPRLRVLCAVLMMALLVPAAPAEAYGGTFKNQVRNGAADPFITYKDGFYYLVFTQVDRVQIHKSNTLEGMSYAKVSTAYVSPSSTGMGCCNIWAPSSSTWMAGGTSTTRPMTARTPTTGCMSWRMPPPTPPPAPG